METCLACSAKLVIMQGPAIDQRGVCPVCAGVYLNDRRVVLATDWCRCKNVEPDKQVFYMTDNGGHGWLHTVCGQITQTG